jgi:hypothetical protein
MLDERSRHHLPRALQWTLMSFPTDLWVVVPPVSRAAPASAEVLVLDEPPDVRKGRASRLALRVTGTDGNSLMFALDAVSERAERAVAVAEAGSVVVIEEDESAPNGRRFAYVAAVRRVSNAPDLQPQDGQACRTP